jgi:alanine racemase
MPYRSKAQDLGTDYLAVAYVEEAVELRDAGY